MKFIHILGFLCLSVDCFDWRGTLLNGANDVDYDNLVLQFPLLPKYSPAFSKFYKNIQLIPDGVIMLDKWANVLDYNYDWTQVNAELNRHGLPGVMELMASVTGFLDGVEKNSLSNCECEWKTIKYLWKSDKQFQESVIREFIRSIKTPEVESLLGVMNKPVIVSEFIDLSVNIVQNSSDLIIEFLLSLKSKKHDNGKESNAIDTEH